VQVGQALPELPVLQEQGPQIGVGSGEARHEASSGHVAMHGLAHLDYTNKKCSNHRLER